KPPFSFYHTRKRGFVHNLFTHAFVLPDLPEVSAETAVSDPFIRRFLRSGSRIGRNDKNASMQ
ncbi:hypothetical protein, partial [Alitiscatomonas aceti]